MIRNNVFAAAALVAASLSVAAPAQSGWTTVGQVRIGGDASTATIPVRWQKQFREIMFCVDGPGVRLQTLTLQLGEARPRVFRLGARIDANGCSRATGIGKNKEFASADIGYDAASLAGGPTKLQLVAR